MLVFNETQEILIIQEPEHKFSSSREINLCKIAVFQSLCNANLRPALLIAPVFSQSSQVCTSRSRASVKLISIKLSGNELSLN